MWDLQVETCCRISRFCVRHARPRSFGGNAGEYSVEMFGNDILGLADALRDFAICVLRLVAGWRHRTVDCSARPERVTHLVLANTSPKFVPRTNWEARIAAV